MSRLPSVSLLFSCALFGAFFAACTTETGTDDGASGGAATQGGSAGVGQGGAAGTTSGAAGSGAPTGGSPSGGSAGAGVGGTPSGGSAGAGPSGGSGGSPAAGGSAGDGMGGGGGTPMAGQGAGGSPAGGSGGSGAGGPPTGDCTFTVTSQTADKAGTGGIPTVGIVNWSVDLAGLTEASIDFGTEGGTQMSAPVDPATGPDFRTLLLGMKGSRMYTFRINARNASTQCQSQAYTIMTGTVPNTVPRITRTAGTSASPRAGGFIITSTGIGGGMGGGGSSSAFIFDADGDPVWWASAPSQCSRAKMSVEGDAMWMMSLNVGNQSATSGRMDRLTMDGLTRMQNVSGMTACHHDFTTVPGGKVACLSWIRQSGDQPSDIIERDAQGTISTFLRIDSAVYQNNTYHANAIHYHPEDDTYMVADRNPNLMVKVGRSGVIWQLGGSCSGAPAAKCVAGSWRVNHGVHLADANTLLFFNNGTSGASTAFQYTINDSGSTFTATEAWNYRPGTTSNVLGDIQKLPNGNVLVTFSTAGVIHEIDSSRTLIQSFSFGAGGYAEWRPSLYGPPPRY